MSAMGIEPGDISPQVVLRDTPPEDSPLQAISRHMGPAMAAPQPSATQSWDTIVRATEKFDNSGPAPGGMG